MPASFIGRALCRLGIHGYPRSQGCVGYCSRGCGDLKFGATGPYITVLYVPEWTREQEQALLDAIGVCRDA